MSVHYLTELEDVSVPLPPTPFPTGLRHATDIRSEQWLMADGLEWARVPTIEELRARGKTFRYYNRYDREMKDGRSDVLHRIFNTPLDQGKCHRRNSRDVEDPYGCGHCVGYGGKTMLLLAPVMNVAIELTGTDIYFIAQDHDEWREQPDEYGQEPYNGSSLNGLMKAGRTLGFWKEWLNVRSIEEAARWMLAGRGPIANATYWYGDMFYPQRYKTRDGRMWLEPTGANSGCHLWVMSGVNIGRDWEPDDWEFRMEQTWGNWGVKGRAWIKGEKLQRLYSQRQYPAAAPFELYRPAM